MRIFEDLFIAAVMALKTDPKSFLGAKTVFGLRVSKIATPPLPRFSPPCHSLPPGDPSGPSHGYEDMQGASFIPSDSPHLKPKLLSRPLLMNKNLLLKIVPRCERAGLSFFPGSNSRTGHFQDLALALFYDCLMSSESVNHHNFGKESERKPASRVWSSH